MSWTDERVTLLTKLWGDGRTAAEIAKILGAGFTRNAVIGKAHRLKLSTRMSPVSSATTAKVRTPANTQKKRTLPRAKPAPQVPIHIDVKGIKMIDLKERMCRWPLGDPKDADFKFCGCDAVPGLPYCPGHARMAFQVNKRSRVLNPDERASEEVDLDMIKSMVAGQ